MAIPDQFQLQAINEIAESLSSCERRTLFYLCENLGTDHSAVRMKEMLKSKVMGHQNAHLFLAELMWRLGRLDILKKVCKVSRDDLERIYKSGQTVPPFRVLMANINEDLESDDLNRIKFLLGCKLSREKLEKAENFLDIVVELEKLDSFSPENVGFVEECLRNIGRIDLAKKLTGYTKSVLVFWVGDVTPDITTGSCYSWFSSVLHPRNFITTSLGVPVQQLINSLPVCYKFNTNPRGLCVIIDCVGNDGELLEKTFKALHFSVILHKYLSAAEILLTLETILSQKEKLRDDSFVCCIISRGTESRLLGTDLTGSGLSVDKVRRLFTANACPVLAGKPKLFFIQRYSIPEHLPCPRMNHLDENLETDGCDGVLMGIPTDADMFWSHCWTDERQLNQIQHCSVYLKTLTDALHKAQKRKINIFDVQTEVNGAVFEHSRRNPGENYQLDVKHTLRKDLYLQ
uniref:CASP8 and FADD-like apoptosis regulator n=1 Tax=Amphilophus citrinellus TaxID=61819 RepID=A0A3Q0QWQ3_AMPCI